MVFVAYGSMQHCFLISFYEILKKKENMLLVLFRVLDRLMHGKRSCLQMLMFGRYSFFKYYKWIGYIISNKKWHLSCSFFIRQQQRLLPTKATRVGAMSVCMSNKKTMSFNHQLLSPVAWASTAPGGEIQWKIYYMFCIRYDL